MGYVVAMVAAGDWWQLKHLDCGYVTFAQFTSVSTSTLYQRDTIVLRLHLLHLSHHIDIIPIMTSCRWDEVHSMPLLPSYHPMGISTHAPTSSTVPAALTTEVMQEFHRNTGAHQLRHHFLIEANRSESKQASYYTRFWVHHRRLLWKSMQINDNSCVRRWSSKWQISTNDDETDFKTDEK